MKGQIMKRRRWLIANPEWNSKGGAISDACIAGGDLDRHGRSCTYVVMGRNWCFSLRPAAAA